jgi:tRNA (mo5U34)-methyltransferase
MSSSKNVLLQKVESVPFWFHSIDLGQGIVTPGHNRAAVLREDVQRLRLPDLKGKTVLDVNAWDGYYSFEAERRGAARVVALDKMMWAMDLGGWKMHFQECREKRVAPLPFQQTPYWHPETLPGKAGFDVAREALKSDVVAVVDDLMEMDVSTLGQFDVVLFLGTLYHMVDPLNALRRVARVTKNLAIIETEAVTIPGFEDRALGEFFPGNELHGDSSNWWSFNERALLGLCRTAGFNEARLVGAKAEAGSPSGTASSIADHWLRRVGLRPKNDYADSRVFRYRAIIHATKQ